LVYTHLKPHEVLFTLADTQVVILAGGLATRLGHLTKDLPKSLVEIQGRPFLEYQLDLLRRAGIRNIVLCVGYLGEKIEGYCGDGRKHGVNICYSYDDTPLGTAGALKNAASLLNDTFCCMYGDSYLSVDFPAVMRYFEAQDKLALMTVFENHDRFDKSNTAVEGNIVSRYDKQARLPKLRRSGEQEKTREMAYIDYGVSILRKRTLDMVPDGRFYSLEDLFPRLIALQELLAYEVTERFYEIGSPQGFTEFNEYVKGVR
jgi:NDP-sugar pyrophosphorylase family protein